MELSDMETPDWYDNGHEQNKIKVDDFLTSTDVCMQGVLALYELRDSGAKSHSKFQISLKMFKMLLHIVNLLDNCHHSKNTILELIMQNYTWYQVSYISEYFLLFLLI